MALAARPDAAFRGSTTYASLNAHAGEDLGRRDDLWSWLYCVAELAEGVFSNFEIWKFVSFGQYGLWSWLYCVAEPAEGVLSNALKPRILKGSD